MIWQIVVRRRAIKDLERAEHWYETQEKGLGHEYVVSIQNALAMLEQNPHIRQIYYKKFRQMLPAKFPYRIMYFIDGRKVIVARVFHQAQDFTKKF